MSGGVHRIPVAISSCLLGERVRFDGGHKLDPDINTHLAALLEFRPCCPEVAIGLGIPRPPIRLVRTHGRLRALGVSDPALDVTGRLAAYGDRVACELDDVCGYIFKARSPSCGMAGVRTWDRQGRPGRSDGVGVYADAIMRAHPGLPVEEEDRLHDPALRENFIERVFTRHHWQQLRAQGITPARLVQFHTRHKLSVMTHNQAAYRRLGQLVAGAGRKGFHALCDRYEQELMQAMQRQITHQHPATSARLFQQATVRGRPCRNERTDRRLPAWTGAAGGTPDPDPAPLPPSPERLGIATDLPGTVPARVTESLM
jgi:uncharacterized protein YbbK (DUF523 family)